MQTDDYLTPIWDVVSPKLQDHFDWPSRVLHFEACSVIESPVAGEHLIFCRVHNSKTGVESIIMYRLPKDVTINEFNPAEHGQTGWTIDH